jgi:hypothetical protein
MTAHLWIRLVADLKRQHALRHVPFELLLQIASLPKAKVPAHLSRIAAGQR